MSQSICSTGLRWLWLVVVVLIIDLGSKYLILQNFALGDTVPLFPSLNPIAAVGSVGSLPVLRLVLA